MVAPKLTPSQEWQRGWTMVMAAFVGFSFFSVMIASTGVFMEPLGREFGWTKTQTSSGVSISGIMTAVLSPFFGILIDKWGTRRLALPGLVAMSLLTAAFSLNNGSFNLWIAMWLTFGFVALSIKSTVWSTTVAAGFESARGMALGVMLCGTAFAQMVTPPLANWLITEFGWRMAFVWLGLGWGAIALAVCIPFLHDLHLRTDAALPGQAPRPQLPGLSVAQAWRDRALWQIGISTFLIMVVTIGLMIHQFEIMREAGVSRTSAAWLTSVFGLGGIIGKLVTGVLIDRFPPNWIGGLTLGSAALAFLLLMSDFATPTLIVVAMAVNGYASGTKLQITGYMTTRFAGLKNFGKIFGMMAAVIAGGTSLGPLLAARIRDLTGDYTLFLAIGVVCSLIGGLLIITLPRYPAFEAPGIEPEEAEALAATAVPQAGV
jgi:predicted MFS family arabinose efflux permease